MEMDFSLSPDTQAILLLCGSFGRQDRTLAPLTPGQYNVFIAALLSLNKRPSDLMGVNGPDVELVKQACAVPNDNHRVTAAKSDQIVALLRRGITLSAAIDKWAAYGVRVAGKADETYPKRLRDHLGGKAPTLVYYAGNPELFAGGGMAFVGARDINEEASQAIRAVVRGCVDLGMPVVSGGARGADQTAMQEAASLGGKVLGALPCDLLKACLDPANRDALADGNALLFSAFDPELRPYSYGQVAMDRNKYIYGMADACFVAQSGIGSKSGTWSGAAEELKREGHRPVYVFLGNPPSEGCLDLRKLGAKAWDMAKPVTENLSGGIVQASEPLRQGELFGVFPAAEAKSTYEVEPSPNAKPSPISDSSIESPGASPYGMFCRELQELVRSPRKEADVKKRLSSKCDLVPAQFKRWMERAVKDGIVERNEYPVGKKGKVAVMIGLPTAVATK